MTGRATIVVLVLIASAVLLIVLAYEAWPGCDSRDSADRRELVTASPSDNLHTFRLESCSYRVTAAETALQITTPLLILLLLGAVTSRIATRHRLLVAALSSAIAALLMAVAIRALRGLYWIEAPGQQTDLFVVQLFAMCAAIGLVAGFVGAAVISRISPNTSLERTRER
jgi:hypothetical protein